MVGDKQKPNINALMPEYSGIEDSFVTKTPLGLQ